MKKRQDHKQKNRGKKTGKGKKKEKKEKEGKKERKKRRHRKKRRRKKRTCVVCQDTRTQSLTDAAAVVNRFQHHVSHTGSYQDKSAQEV